MRIVKDLLFVIQLDLQPTGLRRADHIELLGFRKMSVINVTFLERTEKVDRFVRYGETQGWWQLANTVGDHRPWTEQ